MFCVRHYRSFRKFLIQSSDGFMNIHIFLAIIHSCQDYLLWIIFIWSLFSFWQSYHSKQNTVCLLFNVKMKILCVYMYAECLFNLLWTEIVGRSYFYGVFILSLSYKKNGCINFCWSLKKNIWYSMLKTLWFLLHFWVWWIWTWRLHFIPGLLNFEKMAAVWLKLNTFGALHVRMIITNTRQSRIKDKAAIQLWKLISRSCISVYRF